MKAVDRHDIDCIAAFIAGAGFAALVLIGLFNVTGG
jgi:hypothetical protein